jgi:hypothetical protein
MDQNYVIKEQQQVIQQQLVQQQLAQHPQQQSFVPLQYCPIQQRSYGIIQTQRYSNSIPSFTNVQPSQQTPGLINIRTTNNIGRRQSEKEQEIENESTASVTGRQSKKEEKHSNSRKQNSTN